MLAETGIRAEGACHPVSVGDRVHLHTNDFQIIADKIDLRPA
jgi:hypothetical protein